MKEEENFIVFEKNRKDYKVKGYKNLSCDSFFQKYNDTSSNEETESNWWENKIPKDIPVFYPLFNEQDGSKFYKTTNYVKNLILEILFPEQPLYNIENSDVEIRVIKHKINKYGIDTALLEISPVLGSFIDFIPVCIIIYNEKTEYIHTWRKKSYTPGDNLGIMVPYKFNTVTKNKHGILVDDIDTLIDAIEEKHPRIYEKIENFLLEEDYESADFDKFAINTIYYLLTGDTIPEIKYNKEKLIESMNLIQC